MTDYTLISAQDVVNVPPAVAICPICGAPPPSGEILDENGHVHYPISEECPG